MCTAETAPVLNSSQPSSSFRTRRSVFGMKLPRYNATSSAAAGAALRANEESPRSQHLRQEQSHEQMTPRASGRQGGRAGAAPFQSSSGHMRRCQSANSAARRPRSAGAVNDTMRKSRSHSQEPANYHRHQVVTRELPIPPSQRGGHGPSIGRSVDKGDLTRMYDYATWNMYERIVSARRRRLSALDAEEQSQSSPGSGAAGNKATSPAAGAEASKTPSQSALHKASSHDEQSTLATADETDKSSTASSSWSRPDSPAAYPGMNVVAFPHLHPREVHSCPPPGYERQASEDDSFIFEMDM